MLIATPGRLYDFLSRGLVELGKVRILVLDEADRMLDMGFLPTIKRIIAAVPKDRQTMLFSATIETSVKHLVETQVRNAVRIEVGSTTKPVDKIDLHLYEVDADRKLGLLQMMLREESGSFLVFTRTKHGADRLAKKLSHEGLKTATIHGNRSQNQRSQALKGFQDGYYRVLVATDIAARGIHVEGISHVVNYDLPQVAEDFIHRVGRTGRAGACGTASTFATRGERADIAQIELAVGCPVGSVCAVRGGRGSRAEVHGSRNRYAFRLGRAESAAVVPVVCAAGTTDRSPGSLAPAISSATRAASAAGSAARVIWRPITT